MQPRQLARSTTFEPDALKAIFSAFDSAWSEIAPCISSDGAVVEAARTSLATIMLGLANTNALTPDGLRAMGVAVFCAKYGIEIGVPASRPRTEPRVRRQPSVVPCKL